MRGIEKLAAVERSTPPMAEAFPALPMAETVLLRLLRIGLSGLGQFMEPVFQQIGLNDHAFHVLCLLVAWGLWRLGAPDTATRSTAS